jgi:hypothetical protein
MKKRSNTRTIIKTNKKNGKKKNRRNQNNSSSSVEELLQAAELAMTTMDVPQAISLYSSAAKQLRAAKGDVSVDVTSLSNVVLGASSSHEHRQRQLIQVLEKLGEARVSMGEQDKAQEHFREGIQLLEQCGNASATDEGAGTESTASSTTTKDLYYYETRSNLYMYIGQLCAEHEALQAYKEGLTSLEMCVQLVEAQQQQKKQQLGQEPTAASIPLDTAMQNDDDDEEEHDKPNVGSLLEQVRRKLAGAYCTAAELFLTDLCFEDTAESDCEAYLQKALQAFQDGTTGQPVVDALQTMASLRLSQDPTRRREAIPYILQAFDTMKKGTDALASLIGLLAAATEGDEEEEQRKMGHQQQQQQLLQPHDQALELHDVEAATNLPEFEFRTQTAKLLLECAALLREQPNDDKKGGNGTQQQQQQEQPTNQDQEQHCVMAAISVLGSLLAQNDEVVEIWYLTGCAFSAKRNPATPDAARYHLQRAMEMLLSIQNSLKQEAQFASQDDDEQQELEMELENNASQMHDVQAKLDELPAEEEDDEEDMVVTEDQMQE